VFEENNSYNAFDKIIQALKESINCSLPCQVKKVYGNYVDVLVFRNDEILDGIAPNVPIKRDETKRAYIFLGIKEGDYGTIRYYDKSIEAYKKGDTNYNGDDRCHNLNDGCFELGFIPDNEAFIYPTNADIEIGLKDGSAKVNITNGNITITGGSITITGSSVSLGSNTTIDGKLFLEHTHSNGNQGNPTGGVI
jgi:hypothetical protein